MTGDLMKHHYFSNLDSLFIIMESLVSILIPNFNKQRFVVEMMDSIISQSYQNWECIIVDDHSTDESFDLLVEISEREPRLKVVKRPDSLPKGANSCRNHAFSLSTGDFIQWFDSDDIMFPNCIKDKMDFIKNNQKINFVASKAEIVYEEGYVGNKKFKQTITADDVIADYLKFKVLFITAGPLFRRKVFDKVGLFRLGLKKHQEWELFFRVVLAYPKWGVLNKTTYQYKINNESISAKISGRMKLVKAEIHAIKTAISPAKNPFVYLIPSSTRRYFLLRYLKFCLIHWRSEDALWFAKQYLSALFKDPAPIAQD